MAYVIAKPCIGVKDTACVKVCPVDCISPTSNDPRFAIADQLFIDPNVCVDCGLCQSECPVRAIFPSDDVPAEWSDFILENAAFFRDVQRES